MLIKKTESRYKNKLTAESCFHLHKILDSVLAPATLHKQKHLLIFNRPASHCQPKAYFRESR